VGNKELSFAARDLPRGLAVLDDSCQLGRCADDANSSSKGDGPI
jgi:hypothetical protein